MSSYAGLRPATGSQDYVIEASSYEQFITVGGIRSTGLSASLGIGAYVLRLFERTFYTRPHLSTPVWPGRLRIGTAAQLGVYRPDSM